MDPGRAMVTDGLDELVPAERVAVAVHQPQVVADAVGRQEVPDLDRAGRGRTLIISGYITGNRVRD